MPLFLSKPRLLPLLDTVLTQHAEENLYSSTSAGVIKEVITQVFNLHFSCLSNFMWL